MQNSECSFIGKIFLFILLLPCIFILSILIIVLAPIVGLFAVPIFGIKLLLHKYLANYHYDRTINKEGVYLVNGSNYMKTNAKFTQEDIPRIQHEIKRLYHVNSEISTRKWFQQMLRCIIPIGGLIWVILVEMNEYGSMELGCQGCENHWNHWTKEEALQYHLEKLKPNNTDSVV